MLSSSCSSTPTVSRELLSCLRPRPPPLGRRRRPHNNSRDGVERNHSYQDVNCQQVHEETIGWKSMRATIQ